VPSDTGSLEPVRVLSIGSMYPPDHLGGYELMWQSAVVALRARDHEVRVVASDFKLEGVGDGDGGVNRELRWYWRDHGFPALSLRERLSIERDNLGTLDRHLAEFSPEVVSFWAMGGMSMSLVERVRRLGYRMVGVVHEDWMVYGPRVDAWQRTFGRRGVARLAEVATGIPTVLRFDDAALWLFNSEATRAAALARWDLARTAVVTPGVDLDLFQAADPHPWAHRLLYVGRIDSRKGIATAITSLTELPQAHLRVVGSGDHGHLAELQQLVTRLELPERVEFLELPRHALPGEYAQADALLFPVIWEEPWGLVPLEAMAVGTPVIASGRGGSAEFLRDGENACLYGPAESPEQLAQAVQRLAGDESLRLRLVAGGTVTARQHSQDAFAARIVQAHEDLVA
jgi:glycogen synthase